MAITVFGLLLLRTFVDGPLSPSSSLAGVLGSTLLALAIVTLLRRPLVLTIWVLLSVPLLFSTLEAIDRFGVAIAAESIRLMSLVGLFLMARYVIVHVSAHRVFRLVQITAALSAVVSLYQFTTGTGMLIEGDFRSQGLLAHPNSAVLLYAVAIMVTIAQTSQRGIKKLDVALLALLTAGLALTLSIGGLLSFVIMFLCFVSLVPKMTLHTRLLYLAMPLTAAASVAFSPAGQQRLAAFNPSSATYNGGRANSLAWRQGRWREILAYWHEKPVLGQGYGATTNGQLLGGYVPHNEYVRILVEVGIVGMAVFLTAIILLFTVLVRGLKGSRETSTVSALAIAIVIGLLVSASGDNTFLYSVPMYLVVLLLGVACRQVSVPSTQLAEGNNTHTRQPLIRRVT